MFEREENSRGVERADLAVGIASHEEADSIAYPTEQASLGLVKYYGDKKTVIINADNNSLDGTEEAFLNTETEVPKIYITTPSNVRGKGYNFENMFRKSLELGAQFLICVDADLTSISPEWIKNFGDPLAHDYDFVNPIYSRHKYDGTITNNICFPLVYGLYGRNIRQPIGGDFALSRRFMEHLIQQPWHRTTGEYGIDIFLTMNAVVGGFKTCNTGLGAKRHKPSAPKLGPMFVQVVDTAFLTILRSYEQWKSINSIMDEPLFGFRKVDEPQDLVVDRSAIDKQARKGFKARQDVLEKVLSPELYSEMTTMFCGGAIDISADQWVSIVYQMIAAYSKSIRSPGTVIDSFKSLYFGRTLSFMNLTWDWSNDKSEQAILDQAQVFFDRRGELIERLED